MATPVTPVATAILPETIAQNLGQAAAERVAKRRKLIRGLELEGKNKPATILNLSPFPLRVAPGLISFEVPACPKDKEFMVRTIKIPLTFPVYRGNTEMSDKRIKPEYDVNPVLPVQQIMEFLRGYSRDTGFQGVAHGGIVVYEGDAKVLEHRDDVVRVPRYMQEGTDRFLVFDEKPLAQEIAKAFQELKEKGLQMMHEASTYFDQGSDARRNIDPHTHFVWVDWLLHKKLITKAPVWRNTVIEDRDRCEQCGDQYVSQTGMCKCGYVKEPFKAFEKGLITADHVRMDTLTKEEWKQVKAIQEKREANRK